MRVAVIGGTGPQGKGLAYRFSLVGHEVVIGSRDVERARVTAAEVSARCNGSPVEGLENHEAAAWADIVQIAVPWRGHEGLIESLASLLEEKVVVSCVNPLGFDEVGPFGLAIAESAAEQTQRIASSSAVVGAFHHLSAHALWNHIGPLAHDDVLVCGDSEEAKHKVMELAIAVTGKVGIDTGALRLSRELERLTAVLLSVNRIYRTRSGIAVTGLPSTARQG